MRRGSNDVVADPRQPQQLHAYFATATFAERPRGSTSSWYGFAAVCPDGCKWQLSASWIGAM
ncbi:hypothetical protein AB0G54_42665 [Streptomyces yokosukanensis]|uniref:hypothetical protein n=1 Tax=Streptomyces yokosukanensis TaxID=67386 RepID=UPI003429BBFB